MKAGDELIVHDPVTRTMETVTVTSVSRAWLSAGRYMLRRDTGNSRSGAARGWTPEQAAEESRRQQLTRELHALGLEKTRVAADILDCDKLQRIIDIMKES